MLDLLHQMKLQVNTTKSYSCLNQFSQNVSPSASYFITILFILLCHFNSVHFFIAKVCCFNKIKAKTKADWALTEKKVGLSYFLTVLMCGWVFFLEFSCKNCNPMFYQAFLRVEEGVVTGISWLKVVTCDIKFGEGGLGVRGRARMMPLYLRLLLVHSEFSP